MSTGEIAQPAPRRRRSDGERSRKSILEAAAALATIDGLEGLSIGRLAERTGMSKSGLYAHFGSKQELQLATVEMANEIFQAEVVEPALAAPAGRERLIALCDQLLLASGARGLPRGLLLRRGRGGLRHTRGTGPGRDRSRLHRPRRATAGARRRSARSRRARRGHGSGAASFRARRLPPRRELRLRAVPGRQRARPGQAGSARTAGGLSRRAG